FVGLVFVLIVLAPVIRILRKAGYSPWYSLLLFVPIVNIVMIYVFAFSTWPVDKARQTGSGPGMGGYPEPPWPAQPSQGYVPSGPQSAPGWPAPGTAVPPPGGAAPAPYSPAPAPYSTPPPGE